MKRHVLIAIYDMDIGGIERSLINMLEQFDYEHWQVDLLVFRHTGDLLQLIPPRVNLLPESARHTVFRKPIAQCVREGQLAAAALRLAAKPIARLLARRRRLKEGAGYIEMQLTSRLLSRLMPAPDKMYDLAVSFSWPHDTVLRAVKARRKVAWIHTDFSVIETDPALDLHVWDGFDAIAAVSEACRESFLVRYASLAGKVSVIENITSPAMIRRLAGMEPPAGMAEDRRFKLLTVARLSYAKGLDQAIKALWLLKYRGYDNVAWYVVGFGNEEEQLRELIGQYQLSDSFILLGKQVNPYPYMAGCDLYVQPSRYEGKAVTVTEAQILGRPVLITNYATAASQVADGVDGVIADLSVEGLANGIERLIVQSELRERLARTCLLKDYGNRQELNKLYALAGEDAAGPLVSRMAL